MHFRGIRLFALKSQTTFDFVPYDFPCSTFCLTTFDFPAYFCSLSLTVNRRTLENSLILNANAPLPV
nr:MAG TPA: hypothetical protein [Caudoviricetes sp.]